MLLFLLQFTIICNPEYKHLSFHLIKSDTFLLKMRPMLNNSVALYFITHDALFKSSYI